MKEDGASQDGDERQEGKKSDEGAYLGWLAVIVPNAAMCYAHHRGHSATIFNFFLKGNRLPFGLFALPVVGVMMEKCWYDTSLSLLGRDPKARAKGRHEWPSGGHVMPNLSLVAKRDRPITVRDLAWWRKDDDDRAAQ